MLGAIHPAACVAGSTLLVAWTLVVVTVGPLVLLALVAITAIEWLLDAAGDVLRGPGAAFADVEAAS